MNHLQLSPQLLLLFEECYLCVKFCLSASPHTALIATLDKRCHLYKRIVVLLVALAALVWTAPAVSKSQSRKVLSFTDYDRWSSILNPAISDDGRWVAYTLATAAGSGSLVVRSTIGSTEFRASQGNIGRPQSYDLRPAFGAIEISPDSHFVLFMIANTDQGRPPTLGILDLSNGVVEEIPNVTSFKTAGREHSYVAYNISDPATRADGPDQRLIVRALRLKEGISVRNVGEFLFDDAGKYLIYAISSDEENGGVYARHLASSRVSRISSGPGDYTHLILDPLRNQLAFLSNRDEYGRGDPRYTLYFSKALDLTAVPIVRSAELREDLVISPLTAPRFVSTGETIAFGLVSTRAPHTANITEALELWHWKEPKPLKGALPDGRPRCKTYLAAYYISSKRWTQLSDDEIPLVLLGADGKRAIGLTPYDLEDTWGVSRVDITTIDALTGTRNLVRRGAQPSFQSWLPLQPCLQALVALSAAGHYAMFFEHQRWWSIDLRSGALRDLTGKVPDTRFDTIAAYAPVSQRLSSSPARCGVAGWTAGDRSALVYSDRDLWELDPLGERPPKNLTNAPDDVVLRLLDGDSEFALQYPAGAHHRNLLQETQFIETKRPLLFIGVNQKTLAVSVWRVHLDKSRPSEKLMEIDKWLVPIAKARHTEQFLFSEESYSEFPDLWVGPEVDRLVRITDANPQRSEYKWGSAELFEFTSDFGVQLRGRLYKPDAFDPNKKYPMLVNFYQLTSSSFHRHAVPKPMVAPPTGADGGWPTVVSRGYLYLVPDVLTAAPYPGPSAVAAVLPAVRTMINRGYVDAQRIAIAGHSFGGYETSYIITQTSLFRCAIAGQIISDSFSHAATAYFDMGYMENGQGAHGGSFWERPYVYLTNSAAFYADRVQTPLLLLQNDGDLNTPFTQGLEFFKSLRRNNKEVYLLNYFGEGHTLRRFENQMDWETRFFQFLDYYLKDAPRPVWMGADDVFQNTAVPPHSDNATLSVDVSRH